MFRISKHQNIHQVPATLQQVRPAKTTKCIILMNLPARQNPTTPLHEKLFYVRLGIACLRPVDLELFALLAGSNAAAIDRKVLGFHTRDR